MGARVLRSSGSPPGFPSRLDHRRLSHDQVIGDLAGKVRSRKTPTETELVLTHRQRRQQQPVALCHPLRDGRFNLQPIARRQRHREEVRLDAVAFQIRDGHAVDDRRQLRGSREQRLRAGPQFSLVTPEEGRRLDRGAGGIKERQQERRPRGDGTGALDGVFVTRLHQEEDRSGLPQAAALAGGICSGIDGRRQGVRPLREARGPRRVRQPVGRRIRGQDHLPQVGSGYGRGVLRPDGRWPTGQRPARPGRPGRASGSCLMLLLNLKPTCTSSMVCRNFYAEGVALSESLLPVADSRRDRGLRVVQLALKDPSLRRIVTCPQPTPGDGLHLRDLPDARPSL